MGPAFKGIKMIPPGVHFVFYSSSTRLVSKLSAKSLALCQLNLVIYVGVAFVCLMNGASYFMMVLICKEEAYYTNFENMN